MHCWLEKRSPRRGKDKRTYNRIKGGRWLGLENDRRTGAGRFTSFTLLIAPIDQVLMQIKNEGALTFLSKLKGDPIKRSRDKYCRFHHDHSNDTSDCYDLKQQIEALIRQGKLQRFISKERTNQPREQPAQRENKGLKPPLGDIRMIIGGTTASHSSKKVRKTYLRKVQNVQLIGLIPKMAWINNLVIGFIEEDARCLHQPHDDTIVVSI